MSELIPIADLPDTLDTLGGTRVAAPILWDMSLPPHVDLERIAINARYLRTLHRIGGVSGSLVTAYDGDVSEMIQTVSGINPDGSATAGKSLLTKKALNSQGNYIDPPNGATDQDIGKTILHHRINKPELASQVADKTVAGETSETAWATLLDSALRHSMRQGAKLHLTQRADLIWRLLAYNVVFMTASNDIVNLDSFWAAFSSGFYAVAYGCVLAKSVIESRTVGARIGPRLSIVPGASQPDRYLALSAVSHYPGLVKALK